MKHRKPSRIKASTSLTLAGAAAVVSLLSAPANAAPADPGAVPADQQPDGTSPTTQAPAPDAPKTGTTPDTVQPGTVQPGTVQPGTIKPQPGTTTPTTPTPDNGAQPAGTQPDANGPKADGNANTQPAGTNPQGNTPKSVRPVQPGVTVPRVAPLPVPGQQSQVQPAAVQPTQPGQSTTPGQANQPGQQANQPTKPGDAGTATPAVDTTPQPSVDTMTGPQATIPAQQPQWQSPAVDTAPAAPVVTMTGPHTELGVNLDGGAILPGWAANTHHFSNLDGYVGTIGYTTPAGMNEAGMSLDFTTVNQIKVTAFAGNGPDNDQKMEFLLDTTAVNAAKSDTENFIRLLPGGATIMEAAAQIGRLPEGDKPSQSVDVGGVTAQVGGSVQY